MLMFFALGTALCVGAVVSNPVSAQEPFEPSDVEETPILGSPFEEETPAFQLNLFGDANAYPRLEGEISVEVQNDLVFESEDPDAELNDLYTTTEPFLAFYLTPELSIQSGLVLEPVADPGPSEDRYFEDEGLFVETLGIDFSTDLLSVYGGKFNPPFGLACDITPGIYGVDIAEDYELTERIGFGGALNFGGEGIGGEGIGTHRLSANTFFADTTFLSESLITNRGRTRLSDGGVSNTEDLSSYTLTLDGSFGLGRDTQPGPFEPDERSTEAVFEEPASSDELGYNLGFSFQEAGEGDPENETGVVAGLNASLILDEASEVALEPIVEYVYQWDAEGARQDRQYLTGGTALFLGPWNVSLAYTGRFTNVEATEEDFDDHQAQVSAGYEFDFGLAIDIGYRFLWEEDIDSHTVGILIAYAPTFLIN